MASSFSLFFRFSLGFDIYMKFHCWVWLNIFSICNTFRPRASLSSLWQIFGHKWWTKAICVSAGNIIYMLAITHAQALNTNEPFLRLALTAGTARLTLHLWKVSTFWLLSSKKTLIKTGKQNRQRLVVLYATEFLALHASVVGRINEVNQHRARLVHDGWPGMRVNHL